MSRRRRIQPDSLELLLDTMCNTFGGIIMIALLIALLSRDTDADADAPENARAEVAQVEAQIADAESLQKKLLSQTDTNTAAVIALIRQRDRLEQQMQQAQAAAESNTTARAELIARNDPAESERLRAEREKLSAEVRRLTEEVERVANSKQRQLRLPRERVTGKRTYYLIVRHGKLYPVHLMRNGSREINEVMLDWKPAPSGDAATPKPQAGLDAAGLARLLGEVSAQTYSVHFVVYDDSFPAFLDARQLPLARGYDTGWEFLSQDKQVIFGTQGEAPPAL